MAERLLVARLDGNATATASSAGTRALVGCGMDRTAAQVLREMGGDPEQHVARQLSLAAVRGADLIMTASTMHRSAVVQADPTAMRRTFTMREFARLGRALPPPPDADLRHRVAEVAAQRGVSYPPAPGEDEIADPYGAPLPAMRECGRQLAAAVDAVTRSLGL